METKFDLPKLGVCRVKEIVLNSYPGLVLGTLHWSIQFRPHYECSKSIVVSSCQLLIDTIGVLHYQTIIKLCYGEINLVKFRFEFNRFL